MEKCFKINYVYCIAVSFLHTRTYVHTLAKNKWKKNFFNYCTKLKIKTIHSKSECGEAFS